MHGWAHGMPCDPVHACTCDQTVGFVHGLHGRMQARSGMRAMQEAGSPISAHLAHHRRAHALRHGRHIPLAVHWYAQRAGACECFLRARWSPPTCVFVLQNGQLKAKIEGANTPALNTQILALTPANADVDDLEVRFPVGLPHAAVAERRCTVIERPCQDGKRPSCHTLAA